MWFARTSSVTWAGENHQRGARNAGHSLAGEHEGQHHEQLVGESKPDSGGLRHEDRGQREVERGAVEIETVAGGDDETHNVLGHSEALHVFESQGQGRFAGRSREGDQERLTHGMIKGGERDAE
jgi:hypothetical protein